MIKLVNGLFHNDRQTKQALCNFIMSTDRLSIGPQCTQFEQSFATWQDRKHCVLFNSGSSANLALVQSLLNLKLISSGDPAGFSAITWATNVMPLIQLGLKPIPIDVNPSTLNVSSHTLTESLRQHPHLKLLFLTNLLGFCDDINQIKKICDDQNIVLIEDNCESLGSIYQSTKLGNWGLAGTFSFFVGHHMSTIEGGAVCTDNDKLNIMLRLVRDHGWDRNIPPATKKLLRRRYNTKPDLLANFTFYEPSYNLRPTEITGFLGNNQLRYINSVIKQRHQNFLNFQTISQENPDLVPLKLPASLTTISNMAMPLITKSPLLKHQYMSTFTAADIEIRPLLGGAIPDQPFYIRLFGTTAGLTGARALSDQGFYFPNHEGLTKTDLTKLTALLRTKESVPTS